MSKIGNAGNSILRIKYGFLGLDLPKCNTQHLSREIESCQISDHWIMRFKFSCSAKKFRDKSKSLTSSAKRLIEVVFSKWSHRSLINSKNRVGPRTLPCGTPL